MVPNTIGLLIMARDEPPVISRAINSLKILIDKYLVCDTGSKDETLEIIKKEMGEIPGEIISREWSDYGTNRSYLMQKAYETLNTELLILLDADEVLLTSKFTSLTKEDRFRLLSFVQDYPETDLFVMTTHYKCPGNRTIEYPRYQLLRNNQLYSWELPYHEELISLKSSEIVHIPFIINYARKEGYNSRNPSNIGTHLQKYFEWLKSHPNHPRATFYIARTYQDLKDIDNAIIWYEKRLQLEGKIYEIYISLISLGRLYMLRKEYQASKEKLEKAIQDFPLRLEPYYELMTLYSDKLKQDETALRLGESISSDIKPNPLDSFVEVDIYEWEFKYKLAMIAWRANNKEKSRIILKELLQQNKIPSNEIAIIKNLLQETVPMTTINITSYVGTGAAFKEFTLMLMDTLSEIGYSYVTSREINPSMLNIVIGSAHTPNYYLQQPLPPNTIIVNLEQFYDGSRWDNTEYLELLSKYQVWDYNLVNIRWLALKGIKAKLFRRLHSPKLETISVLPEELKDIDVLFYGAITEERKAMREALQRRLPDKKIFFLTNIWGEQRDQLIARSKITLNIHGYPSNIFETSRVGHLLSNKAFVISETSVDDCDYPELDKGLIRVERGEMVEEVTKYLDLPEDRKRIAQTGYEMVKILQTQIPYFNI